ncbi:MAG: hypothetical protein IJS53_04140 [Clostridia bacterium]|nr:hypothetical protein [Clostridia bacterium]
MKKLLPLLCALTLLFCSCAYAQQTEYTAFVPEGPLLTVSYDPAALRLDTESYLAANTPAHRWLGMFYDGEFTIEFAADRYEGYRAPATPEELAEAVCNAHMRDKAVLLEIWREGEVPFALLRLERPSGESYYAAAYVNGYVVYFEIYNLRGKVDDRALDLLKTLLGGVR